MTYQTPTLFLVGAAQGLVLGATVVAPNGYLDNIRNNEDCIQVSRDSQFKDCTP